MSIIQTGLVPQEDADRVKNLTMKFQEIFRREAEVVVRVPGRLVINKSKLLAALLYGS